MFSFFLGDYIHTTTFHREEGEMGGSLEPSLGRRAMALLPWMTLGIASMAWCYGVTVMAREGAVHQVGGTPGWSLPSRSMVNYTQWAATQMFVVGDTLCK